MQAVKDTIPASCHFIDEDRLVRGTLMERTRSLAEIPSPYTEGVLDKFFDQHPEIVELRDKNFITVNVFYSSENKNEKALLQYPKTEGVPHFFSSWKEMAHCCTRRE